MTQKEINDIAYKAVGCAIEVHKQLGPGLLESVYETCLAEELSAAGLQVKRQVQLPVIYRGKQLDNVLRIDLLVNDCLIIELKSVEQMIPLYKAQLLTYMKLADVAKGLLINFNCENITSQLIPLVNESFARLKKS